MSTVFVGRQPIYGADLRVVAYEVLFRASNVDHACVEDGDRGRRVNSERLHGRSAWGTSSGTCRPSLTSPVTSSLDGHAHALPRDRVVLEVLEDVEPEPEIVAALQSRCPMKVTPSRWMISCTGPTWNRSSNWRTSSRWNCRRFPMTICRVTSRHCERPAFVCWRRKSRRTRRLSSARSWVLTISKATSSVAPKVIAGTSVPVNRLAALRLMHQLGRPNMCARELAEIIGTEPSLCYKLLRFVNSASSR